MKIKFKISCKVIQVSELIKLCDFLMHYCSQQSIENLDYANWFYNLSQVRHILNTRRINHLNSNSNKKVSFKIDLTQFILLAQVFQDSLTSHEYYDDIFRSIIYDPCIKQFDQWKNQVGRI